MWDKVDWRVASLPVLALVVVAAARVPAGAVFAVDASQSGVTIGVGKAGVFGIAGHAHQVTAPSVRGVVMLDPTDWPRSSVVVDFDAASLRVVPTGEQPADVLEVQRVMLSDRVLDAGRYAAVSFRSSRVESVSASAEGARLTVEGVVTLHGVSRPVKVPVAVSIDRAGVLTARGSLALKQTSFGIRPVTAAGGAIRVKDEVEVEFVVKARRRS